jgi:hypothetical protein
MSTVSSRFRLAALAIIASGAIAFTVQRGEAHKAITSKYTYNDDVFPILNARCSRCHVTGGVAPMSLMTYDDAYPWAESIRAELVAAHMPPWNAEGGFGEFKQAHTLSPRELDVILTWATGGNPRGQLGQTLPAVTLKNEWTMGKPDIALPLPEEFTVAADKMEDSHEFTIPIEGAEPRLVRAVDLLPGNPAIVRSATVYVKSPAAGNASGREEPASELVLARWLPGQDPEPIDPGVAFRLPANAALGVRIHYKKTWQYEGKSLADRSTVGVYFVKAGGSAQELLALPIVSPGSGPNGSKDITFSRTLPDDMQALAVSPEQVPPNIALQVQAIRPDGSRAPMIRLNTRPDWARRYWFERPVALPKGTRIEVVARLEDPDISAAAFGSAPAMVADTAAPLRLSLNVVRPTAKPPAP